MKKQHKIQAGLFALSALTLALSGTAHAAPLTDAAAGPIGGSGVATSVEATIHPGETTTSATAVSPFARASDINITGSRHNLGTTNGGNSNSTLDVLANDGTTVIGTNQICVFCHTPHGFNTTKSGPLWNRAVKASTDYTVYNAGGGNGSSTLDAAAPVIGSVSLACLSCHDGTQAMDAMINAPGFGRGNDQTGNVAVSRGFTWNELATLGQDGTVGTVPATNSVIDTTVSATVEGTNLGTDLSNDHPISVQYCGGLSDNGDNATGATGGAGKIVNGTCADRLFNLPTKNTTSLQFWVDTVIVDDPDQTATNGITRDSSVSEVWQGTGYAGDAQGRGFIQGSPDGVRTKQDIMLFTNNSGVTGPSVECASCHDPHTPNNGTFLRVSNSGSGLCLSCHVK